MSTGAEPVNDFETLSSASAAAALKSIQSNPAASEVWIGRSDPTAVVAAGALSLELPPTPATDAEASTAIAFTGIDVDHGEEGMTSLYARDEDTDSEAGLVIQGLDVLGSIRHGDDVYKVLPLGDELTAVYLHDDSQLRRHPEGWEELMHPQVTDAPPRESDGTPGTRSDTGDVVDVMVAYTSEAKVEAGNIDLFVQFAMDNAHRTYRNSDINNPRLRLVHKLETSYSEDTHLLEHLNRVTYTADDPGFDGNYPDADGYMDDVHDVRDRTRRRPHRRLHRRSGHNKRRACELGPDGPSRGAGQRGDPAGREGRADRLHQLRRRHDRAQGLRPGRSG